MTARLRFAVDRRDGVVTIRFDHAPTRNALDRDTRIALVDVLAEADRDDTTCLIVLTGAGGSFTSGVDAKQLLGDPDYVAPPVDPPAMLRSLQTPTIAAVNGACVSGGLEIALACSLIIASDAALFADTHAKLGLTPGWGLSVDLPAVVGVHRARQMTLTGLAVQARTAYEWGLVNEVVPADRLLHRVGEIAAAIRAIPAGSQANALRLYRDGREAVYARAREIEQAARAAWRVDRAAGLDGFRQRVSPPST